MRLMYGVYPHSCRYCGAQDSDPSGPDLVEYAEFRERNGCDKDSLEQQDGAERTEGYADGILCPCQGDREDCPECDGVGRILLFRCPRSLGLEEYVQVAELCRLTKEGGPWPSGGGSASQTHSFIEAHRVVSAETERLKDIYLEKQRKKK